MHLLTIKSYYKKMSALSSEEEKLNIHSVSC